MNKRKIRQQETRRKLEATVLALFEDEEAPAGLSVEDICRRAGVAKGTFYLHFRGKDDLYILPLKRLLLEPLLAWAESDEFQNGPAQTALERFLGRLMNEVTQREAQWQRVLAAATEVNGLELLRRDREELQEPLRQAIARMFSAHAQAIFRPVLPGEADRMARWLVAIHQDNLQEYFQTWDSRQFIDETRRLGRFFSDLAARRR